MDLRRRTLLTGVGTSFVLAGCLGDDDAADTDDEDDSADTDDDTDDTGDMDSGDTGDTDSGDTGDTDTGDTDDDGDEPPEPVVEVGTHDEHGDILVGSDGMTLYMFDADEQGDGSSACTGGCADNWPPLTVDDDPVGGDGVGAALTTFDREDGSTQVAANGWPLYFWANDESPGDATGQGVNDVWWVLDPNGEPIRDEEDDSMDTDTDDGMDDEDSGTDDDSDGDEPPAPTVEVRNHDDHGDILVGSNSMTLYMFDSDEQGDGSSACTGGCADNWPPLTVDDDPVAGDGVGATLTTFDREDGSTQVAANGWPLYFWANDDMPGDATGQGVNDVWWVLDPDGEPIRDEEDDGDAGDGDDEDGGYY